MRYEIFIKEYLPTIRAMIAKKLISYGLTQQEIANKLYLTQPAIAFYKKSLRGKRLEELEKKEEVRRKIEEIARKIMTKNLKEEELEKEYLEIFNLIL
jgi:predicted transcriptional regulator